MIRLAQLYLRSLFDYDSGSGKLVWRSRPLDHFANATAWKIWNARFPGKDAGYHKGDGYFEVGICGCSYPVHRVIWLREYGELPKQIDHINGDGADNRLENLRNVDNATNLRNQSLRRTNKSGVMGVCFRSDGVWRAEIGVGGKRINLGSFKRKSDAIKARLQAEQRFGFHSNHGRQKTPLQEAFRR